MPNAGREWEIRVTRKRQEKRQGMAFARTVSEYQVFHDGAPVAELGGDIVERDGPGDNTGSGVTHHRRVAKGRYPLSTHDGASNDKYMTIGYATNGDVSQLPRPCLRLLNTGERSGILIHPASGYLWSIGCLNPSTGIDAVGDNIKWTDSRKRVISLIDDLRAFLGARFPSRNNVTIPGAFCVIDGLN